MTRLQAEGSGVRFRIFLSPKRPDRRWGPSSVLLNGYRRLTPGLNGRSVMLTALTSLTSKLRIGGATPLLLVRASTQTTLALRFSCAFLSSVRPAVRPSVPNHLSAIHNEISPHLRSTGRTTSAAHFSQNKTHRGLCTSLHTLPPIHHFIYVTSRVPSSGSSGLHQTFSLLSNLVRKIPSYLYWRRKLSWGQTTGKGRTRNSSEIGRKGTT